ncbi:MAG TPA: flagellin [Acidobacteriota bacterium]|nr:flagellin [Acidobacteriota bacterium]
MGITLHSNLTNGLSLLSLTSNLSVLYKSAERLASGLRINRASDDPAGLVISEQLRSQIASLNSEIDNISSVISKYQTVSSTVGELRSQLTDLRALAVAAANEGGNSEEAQQAYNTAAGAIVNTFNSTAQNAEFNGSRTLDGSEGSLAEVSELTDIDLSTPQAAASSIQQIDGASAELDSVQTELGATQKNELESRRASLQVTRENLVAAESQVRDADYGMEYARFVSSMIRTQVAMAMVAHTALNGAGVVRLMGL